MKKTYLQPSLVMAETELVTLVCGSQDITSGSDVNDIGYGGVDEGGTKDPSARRHHNVWDDDEALESEQF